MIPRTARPADHSPGRRCARRPLVLACLLAGLAFVTPARAQESLSFHDAPIPDVIRGIEQRSAYRFLYRDALVSGRRVTLTAEVEGILEAFREAVSVMGLDIHVDEERGQVLVFARAEQSGPGPAVAAGVVLDAETGARLPYATVSWRSTAGLRGSVTDDAGRFTLTLPEGTGPLEVTVSFLGYRSETVSIEPARLPAELSVRLTPQPIVAREVVVRGTMFQTGLDTTWHSLVQPGSLAPIGESGVLRTLQTLPSVSVTSAMTAGMSVRGSRVDGFQVLLDGMPVYGQSHLFGLFDTFNDDAIQAVGFYYGITPASYQAPPGGTLSFLTRSGSRSRIAGSASVSNTSLRGSVEGPLLGGSGSWLVSGRRSIISAIGWMGNDALVSYGLGLDRDHSSPLDGTEVPQGVLRAKEDPAARYFDLHGKAVAETRRGDQFTLSGYVGGDEASLVAERVIRLPGGQGGQGGQSVRRPADTDQQWGNVTAGASWKRPMGSRALSVLSLGFTGYSGSYARSDFVFPDSAVGGRPNGQGNRPQWRLGTFSSASDLAQWRFAESVSWSAGPGGLWAAGLELNAYDNTYEETALNRIGFRANQRTVRTDAYVGYTAPAGARLGADVGLRAHYFGLGSHWGVSPRLDLRFVVADALRITAGVSRNFQFLYRIALEHEPTVDIWSLSGATEEPTRMDYVTGGIHLRPLPGVFFQAEIYRKEYRNLRLHELTTRYAVSSNVDLFTDPWLWDARGTARGLEAMLRYDVGPVSVVNAYTLSTMRIAHRDLDGGREFAAWWDRPHEGSVSLRAGLGARVHVSATWSVASGTPNTLAARDSTEAARLPAYHRLDLTLSARVGRRGSVRLGLYNAYDRRNVWYRAAVPILGSGDQTGRLAETANVDVYDLGIQPSLELTYRF